MAPCSAREGAGIVEGVVGAVDCHIRILVHDSYRNLVGPDTLFSAVFTALLTIYIALIGYQLMFGRGGLRVMELPFTAMRIGLILAFLTSWAAYQTVVFNLLFEGPTQLTSVMMRPLAQGDANPVDLYVALEEAFARLGEAASVYGAQASPNANILQGGPMLGSGLLWLSSIVMLLSVLGLIVAAKIVLAFLLAVGPVFIGFFLFDATRGLFDGWLRTTLAFALAPLAVHVFGVVMLMVLSPFIASLGQRIETGAFDMSLVITIGLIVLVFAAVMLFGLMAMAGIARGLDTARRQRDMGGQYQRLPAPQPEVGERPGERVERLAARMSADDRTASAGGYAPRTSETEGRRTGQIADAVGGGRDIPATPIGQSYRRNPGPASRRDGE